MTDSQSSPRSGPPQVLLAGVAIIALALALVAVFVGWRLTRPDDTDAPAEGEPAEIPNADDTFVIAASLPSGTTPDEARLGALNVLFIEGATITSDGVVEANSLPANVPSNPFIVPLIAPETDAETFAAQFDGLSTGDTPLAIHVPPPVRDGDSWDTLGYDWVALSEVADYLVVTPPGTPADYINSGDVADFLGWAATEIDLSRLLIATSTQSIDVWGARSTPVDTDFALNPLGGVIAVRDDPAASPKPGDVLTFTLRGDATDVTLDDATGTLHYRVLTGDGEHIVWVVTPAALRTRLDWLQAQGIGGVVLTDFAAGNDDPAILTAVQEFRTGRASTLTNNIGLYWTITDPAGNLLYEETTSLTDPLTWTPTDAGEYIIHAEVTGDRPYPRGAEAVIVGGGTVGIAPEQEGVVVGGPTPAPGSVQPTPVPIPEGLPPPVVPPRVSGNFELGGQVNHVIETPDRMKEAGMEWVKFQIAWGEGDTSANAWTLIEQGREHGFKVLLSITSNRKYPTEINIEEYLEYLRGVAYYGPDAIEVWNEANLDYEWPRGEINGANYTREMLAPAYNAIKSVNPNIMVISGALAPTGAFYGDGGCSVGGTGCDDWLYLQQMAEAGAANYMDCVGTHFNAGATAPSEGTGHPADPGFQHYSWYFGGMLQLYGGMFGKQVCFTELGYLSGEGYGTPPERFNWASDTSVAEQAAWLAEAAQLSRESGNVRLMIVWNFDFNYWGDDPMAGYAIVRPDGSCPACQTLGTVMR